MWFPTLNDLWFPTSGFVISYFRWCDFLLQILWFPLQMARVPTSWGVIFQFQMATVPTSDGVLSYFRWCAFQLQVVWFPTSGCVISYIRWCDFLHQVVWFPTSVVVISYFRLFDFLLQVVWFPISGGVISYFRWCNFLLWKAWITFWMACDFLLWKGGFLYILPFRHFPHFSGNSLFPPWGEVQYWELHIRSYMLTGSLEEGL